VVHKLELWVRSVEEVEGVRKDWQTQSWSDAYPCAA